MPQAAAARRLQEEEAHREAVTEEFALGNELQNDSDSRSWPVLADFYSTENVEEPHETPHTSNMLPLFGENRPPIV
jgi:hypothetical protein